jgi:tol-pal system protein YbgF
MLNGMVHGSAGNASCYLDLALPVPSVCQQTFASTVFFRFPKLQKRKTMSSLCRDLSTQKSLSLIFRLLGPGIKIALRFVDMSARAKTFLPAAIVATATLRRLLRCWAGILTRGAPWWRKMEKSKRNPKRRARNLVSRIQSELYCSADMRGETEESVTFRNRFGFSITAVFLLSAFATSSILAQEKLPALIRQIQPSVVTIIIRNENGQIVGQGSGFFADQQGHIITNRHVLEGAIRAEIKTEDRKIYSIAKIVAEDKEADLIRATVNLGRDVVRPLKISHILPEVGERVLVIGSPLGLEQTVTEGIVSSVRASGKIIQISAPISPGSSGSPVVNARGEVIGVATSQVVEGQNLNFAVSARKLSEMKSGAGKALILWTAGSYGEGLEFLEQKNYTAGLETFTKFVKHNPSSKYVADAHYWIGECYYALGKYDDAFEAFGRVGREYPNSERVPASYRMLALAMAKRSGSLLDPIGILQILIEKFPQSEEAIKARDQLREWATLDRYIFPSGSLAKLREARLLARVTPEGTKAGLSENNLRRVALDALSKKLPSLVVNNSASAFIAISVQLAPDQKGGKNELFGTVTFYVLDLHTKKIAWGKSHYVTAPSEIAHSTIQYSLESLISRFAADWHRDNP